MVKAYTAADAAQAHMLCHLLVAQDIPATVLGELLSNSLAGFPLGGGTLPAVWVREEDLARAYVVIAQFEQQPHTADAPKGDWWACPNCGEAIEPQFTICWKCQAVRPADADETPVVPASPAPPAPPWLDGNLRCRECDYNLRGLPARHLCPECGTPVRRTLSQAAEDGSSEEGDTIQRMLRRPLAEVAAQTGNPPPAVALVYHSWLTALSRAEEADEENDAEPERGPTAAELLAHFADVLRQRTAAEFVGPAAARAAMRTWGVDSGRAVAEILRALAGAQLIDPPPDDLLTDLDQQASADSPLTTTAPPAPRSRAVQWILLLILLLLLLAALSDRASRALRPD